MTSKSWLIAWFFGTTLAPRLADSFETALMTADGLAIAEDADTGERTTFSSKFACPVSGFTIEEIEPRLFSFNNPFGACPNCDGLGTEIYFDPDLVVPQSAHQPPQRCNRTVVEVIVALLHANP